MYRRKINPPFTTPNISVKRGPWIIPSSVYSGMETMDDVDPPRNRNSHKSCLMFSILLLLDQLENPDLHACYISLPRYKVGHHLIR